METKWVSQELCDERHRALEGYLGRYEENVYKNQSEIKDIQEAIIRLTTLLERYNSEIEDHEIRIRGIEAKPGKIWDNFMIRVVSILSAAAIGGFFGNSF